MRITGSFEAAEKLAVEQLVDTVSAGTGAAAKAVLERRGWKGELAVVPCINLGTDNKTVTGCKIIAKGKMEGVELEAKKYFGSVIKPYKIAIKEIDMDIFNFDENLVSQWVEEDTWDLEYTVDDEEQTREEFRTDGGRIFCIRAQLKPSSQDTCKITLSLAPKSMAEISLMPAQGPGLPSFKVGAKEAPFLPSTTTPWGLKFQPLLLKGSPSATLGHFCQWEARRAIHATLRGAVAMTFCRNLQSFEKKWRAVIDKREAPSVPKADVWPEVEPKATSTADTTQNIISDGGESPCFIR